MQNFFVTVVLPISICVVLPVMIVWLAMRAKQNETNKKTEIMLKAIETGVPVDMEQFNAPKKDSKSVKQELLDRLTGACVTTGLGVAFLILSALDNLGFTIWLSHMLPIAGAVLLAVGIALFISYFVGRKMLADELK